MYNCETKLPHVIFNKTGYIYSSAKLHDYYQKVSKLMDVSLYAIYVIMIIYFSLSDKS